MVIDADLVLNQVMESDPRAAEEWQKFQKLQNDPRVTPLGKFLRKSSLDELPQIWNILRGEMSFVGPRPFMPEQQEIYDVTPTSSAYYMMRPGVTGVWQVSCRNEAAFDVRAFYDNEYANTASLVCDLRIVAKTALVVLRGTGH